MDWFAWLAQTPLHPSLVYNYGVLFACNELTSNDIAYFDHEFLLSMGVAIAKHRLEILKLARLKTKTETRKLRFIPRLLRFFASTARRAKKLARKTESEADKFGRKLSPLKVEWKERCGPFRDYEGLRFMNSPAEKRGKSKLIEGSRKYVSGPINGGKPVVGRSPRFSGPLERSKSPRPSLQLDGPEAHSPWAMLFDDLKPN